MDGGRMDGEGGKESERERGRSERERTTKVTTK